MKAKLIFIVLFIMCMFTGCKGEQNVEALGSKLNIINSNKQNNNLNNSNNNNNQQVNKNEDNNIVSGDAIDTKIPINNSQIEKISRDILANMSLEEKIGQLFIVNFELLDNSQGDYYEFREITKKMKKNLEKYNVGGVVFFSRNIETREQTTKFIEKLQANSKIPLFIAVDEEGGEVSRIANNPNMKTTLFPSMSEIGANENEEYVYNMGVTIGNEIKKLGFNLDFAPVADILTNKNNKEIGNRSFGSDTKLVSKMVENFVKGIQEQNISATLKHFPGHGDADSDSHDGAVIVENDIKRLRKVEFLPFKAGIKQGVDFIMISHISISRVTEDTVPASMSKIVLKDIIRKELEFEGVVITDAFNMKAITDNYTTKEAVVESIKNGTDIILMPQNLKQAYNAVLEALEDDIITEKRINESVLRILRTKVKRGIILPDTNLSKK